MTRARKGSGRKGLGMGGSAEMMEQQTSNDVDATTSLRDIISRKKGSVEMMESHILNSVEGPTGCTELQSNSGMSENRRFSGTLRDIISGKKGSVEMMESRACNSIKGAASLRDMSSRAKGSVELMEYMFLTLFVIFIVIAFVIFLSWWNVSQMDVEKSGMELDKTLVLTKSLISSPFLAREDSMLDDGKLTVLQAMGQDTCTSIGSIYGADWFAVIRLLDGRNDTPCNQTSYPDCNYWSLCKKDLSAPGAKNYRSYVVPVNIYRNMGMVLTTGVLGRSYVGSIEVGVYV